ncbi:MAG: FAD/NAD(P)-binding protein [Candidatus Thiodiazotropha sp.]|nr:FAD/NAD(P)-binding protein [Candidatus Thiodiazotropha sp.]MCM8882239.1 FAD/NAD(P)-binding protein [Candidatus Thiodiazotropha sp.]MCM8920002.1 FAD/NAD(P)-binding protein [Candidatus Thiodiazotropha sp.]
MSDLFLPRVAVIDQQTQESSNIFTLRMQFEDSDAQETFSFSPGQFNMVTLFGVGEIAISIVSDPLDSHFFDHTIRIVGRVSEGLSKLKSGDHVGIRGPFGRGWPLQEAQGRDVLLVTGGLGCAPLVSVIRYLMNRRDQFGHINILQGVKHANDLIWREQYEKWIQEKDVKVLLAADVATQGWQGQQGMVTELIDQLSLRIGRIIALLCGPELMMMAAIANLRSLGLPDSQIWFSMERNMQCGMGQCGHCQIGPKLVCRDGPVFCYSELADFLGSKGF